MRSMADSGVDKMLDIQIEDDYDEDADSDFDAEAPQEEDPSSDSEREEHKQNTKSSRKQQEKHTDVHGELDSGDEATINAQGKKRGHQKSEHTQLKGTEGDEEWRAKTRSMRTQEKEERRRNKLVSSKGSTIDVEKLWAEMMKPGPLPPVKTEGFDGNDADGAHETSGSTSGPVTTTEPNTEGETITIKRTYRFAGELHTEEKSVLKSSAEARLWLAQQEGKTPQLPVDVKTKQRPLRKISRFDPNYNNLQAFKVSWAATTDSNGLKGPKLNVVEKSKMDWAVHVDAEGLKDELDEHAKAKEGYLGRMDFLSQVEQRKESEARMARLKS